MGERIIISGFMPLKNLVTLEKEIVKLNKDSKTKHLKNKAKVIQTGSYDTGAFILQVTAKLDAATPGKKVTKIKNLFSVFGAPPAKKTQPTE